MGYPVEQPGENPQENLLRQKHSQDWSGTIARISRVARGFRDSITGVRRGQDLTTTADLEAAKRVARKIANLPPSENEDPLDKAIETIRSLNELEPHASRPSVLTRRDFLIGTGAMVGGVTVGYVGKEFLENPEDWTGKVSGLEELIARWRERGQRAEGALDEEKVRSKALAEAIERERRAREEAEKRAKELQQIVDEENRKKEQARAEEAAKQLSTEKLSGPSEQRFAIRAAKLDEIVTLEPQVGQKTVIPFGDNRKVMFPRQGVIGGIARAITDRFEIQTGVSVGSRTDSAGKQSPTLVVVFESKDDVRTKYDTYVFSPEIKEENRVVVFESTDPSKPGVYFVRILEPERGTNSGDFRGQLLNKKR